MKTKLQNLDFAPRKRKVVNYAVGKNIPFHYTLRHKFGLTLTAIFLAYLLYRIGYVTLVGLEPTSAENNLFIRNEMTEIGLIAWFGSLFISFGVFDRALRLKIKSWL